MSKDLQANETTLSNAKYDDSTNSVISSTSEAIEKVKEQIRKLDEQMTSKYAAQNEINTNIFQSVSQDIGKLSDGSTSIMTRLSTKSHQLLSRLQRRNRQQDRD
jgi:uncharacterized membrane-anchored protein YhcB (DUF1043 family)